MVGLWDRLAGIFLLGEIEAVFRPVLWAYGLMGFYSQVVMEIA